jgi:hypothetical protein
MKSVILSVDQWKQIRKMLQEEYPKTVFMIRDKMKRVLGFTVREHKRWDEGVVNLMFEIHLDFYSEKKRTMFLLKFSEVIGNPDGKL